MNFEDTCIIQRLVAQETNPKDKLVALCELYDFTVRDLQKNSETKRLKQKDKESLITILLDFYMSDDNQTSNLATILILSILHDENPQISMSLVNLLVNQIGNESFNIDKRILLFDLLRKTCQCICEDDRICLYNLDNLIKIEQLIEKNHKHLFQSKGDIRLLGAASETLVDITYWGSRQRGEKYDSFVEECSKVNFGHTISKVFRKLHIYEEKQRSEQPIRTIQNRKMQSSEQRHSILLNICKILCNIRYKTLTKENRKIVISMLLTDVIKKQKQKILEKQKNPGNESIIYDSLVSQQITSLMAVGTFARLYCLPYLYLHSSLICLQSTINIRKPHRVATNECP